MNLFKVFSSLLQKPFQFYAKTKLDIDEELICRIQSGDTLALNQLVKRWHKLFCNKAFWMVKDKDAARDIAQDSWSIIINKINTLKEPKRFKYWAYRIVCNKSTDWLRIQAKNQKRTVRNSEGIECKDEEYSENTELKKTLLSAIANLPENQRAILKLFYTQDYSLKQISKLLNISVGTAKSRLFHAREKLKRTLKSKYYEN
ncbi:RNA polymerase sigma factor [Winogradskyella sp. A3E31]|uniref:RNA polymerase sigma factor n=1 Tax=Winogradskyella sp. A3E31 TaxID=3349637 RepID=UPI00398AD5FA